MAGGCFRDLLVSNVSRNCNQPGVLSKGDISVEWWARITWKAVSSTPICETLNSRAAFAGIRPLLRAIDAMRTLQAGYQHNNSRYTEKRHSKRFGAGASWFIGRQCCMYVMCHTRRVAGIEYGWCIYILIAVQHGTNATVCHVVMQTWLNRGTPSCFVRILSQSARLDRRQMRTAWRRLRILWT